MANVQKKESISQHLGLICFNNGADGVIICSCTCTDPEYLLFTKNSLNAFSFSFTYTWSHFSEKLLFEKLKIKKAWELNTYVAIPKIILQI